MNFYKKIFTFFIITSFASSLHGDAKSDFSNAILKDDKVAALNAAKTLVTTYGITNSYINTCRTSFNGQYKKNYADLYDDFDYLTGVMINKNMDGQQAIDYAQNQETTKGGDPAALKACTATVTNYATEGTKLQNASKNFYDHTSTPNNYIAGYVQAFIKYADGTDVYKDMAGKELFEGKKWLENYFNPTTCILPFLTDFYDQILSAIAANKNLAQWDIKVDIIPTITNIKNNTDNLKTTLNTFNAGVTGTPINVLYNVFYHPLKTTTLNSLDESEIVFDDNSNSVIKTTTSLGSNDANKGAIATTASGGILPATNYLKDTTKYKTYVDWLVDAVHRMTIEVFGFDTDTTAQDWFNGHQLNGATDANDKGLLGSVRTAIQNIKKGKCPACPECEKCPPATNTGINESIITSINVLERSIKEFVDNCNNEADAFYAAATSKDTEQTIQTTDIKEWHNDMAGYAKDMLSGIRSIYNNIDSSTITDSDLKTAFDTDKAEITNANLAVDTLS